MSVADLYQTIYLNLKFLQNNLILIWLEGVIPSLHNSIS